MSHEGLAVQAYAKAHEQTQRLQGFLDPEAFFRSRRHGFTARATGDCILVSVDQAHKETLVRCYPDLASRILEA